MMIEEAINRVSSTRHKILSGTKQEVLSNIEMINLLDTILVSLQKARKYIDIGTVEECREAIEKQAEKKVLYNEKAKRYFCPTCERKCNYMHSLYCSGCGQKLDWSDEE